MPYPKVLDPVLVGFAADVLDEQAFQPVHRVDNQRLEVVRALPQLGDEGSVICSQFSGWAKRVTFRWMVPPSVSRKTGSGKAAASVLLPMPSGP